MSDIEDYTYSPYDDIEDILDDVDPALELADDLADHSMPSPVYQDEIAGYDMQEYFSDWDYYSDDYMDDDPSLLKIHPQDGTVPRQSTPQKPEAKAEKRGKKRKLADRLNAQPSDEELLVRNIKGTLWARPTSPRTPPYQQEDDTKVALMKNWREIFAITDSGWGRDGENTEEDESWAKDMSLADMGLQNVQGKGVDQNIQRDDDAEQARDEEDDEYEELMLAEEDEERDDVRQPGAAIETQSNDESKVIEDMEPKPPPQGTETGAAAEAAEDPVDDGLLPRKRRRMQVESTISLASESADASKVATKRRSATQPGSPIEKRLKDTRSIAQANTEPPEHDKSSLMNGSALAKNKKRKATEEPEESGMSRSTASSRAKRVAANESKSAVRSVNAPRRTRQSKK
ncbi:hypothetical protein RBB50_002263 [Rhinocladiella similis]